MRFGSGGWLGFGGLFDVFIMKEQEIALAPQFES